MGGKSVTARADNYKARKKLAKSGIMRNLFEERASQERSPPTRDEHTCEHCGFKAKYKFIRCPSCEKEQK